MDFADEGRTFAERRSASITTRLNFDDSLLTSRAKQLCMAPRAVGLSVDQYCNLTRVARSAEAHLRVMFNKPARVQTLPAIQTFKTELVVHLDISFGCLWMAGDNVIPYGPGRWLVRHGTQLLHIACTAENLPKTSSRQSARNASGLRHYGRPCREQRPDSIEGGSAEETVWKCELSDSLVDQRSEPKWHPVAVRGGNMFNAPSLAGELPGSIIQGSGPEQDAPMTKDLTIP